MLTNLNMRQYIKYLSLISILAVLSCQKQTDGPDTIYAEGGLVSFSTRVHTKAPVITSLSGKYFGVYGFSYSNLTNWNTAKTKGTPNEFLNLSVSGTDCSYSYSGEDAVGGYKKWDLDKGYTFFAYYPYTELNDADFRLSQLTDENGNPIYETPYIDYTLPISAGGTVNPDAMLDVMTAAVKDHSLTFGPVVGLNFYHRLFCIDLSAINHNTETDVKIKDLSVTIKGIHYNKTRIYMDKDRVVYDENQKKDVPQSSIPASDGWSTGNPVTFSPMLDVDELEISAKETIESLSNNQNLIMLIPQNSSVDGAVGLFVEVNFKKYDSESREYVQYYTKDNIPLSGTFYLNFQEGSKYSLTLNFLDNNEVTLIAANAGPWDLAEDVNHTFD